MMPLRLACVLGVTAFFSLVQGCSTATTPPPSEEETGEETPGDDDTEEKKDDEKAADPAAPTTTTPPVVEAPAPPPPVVKSAMTFFVTSVAAGTGGNLGGLAGADTKCKDLAAAAPIKGDDHTWAAYLSVQGTDAKTRIGTGPWTNQKGKVIAADIASLHKVDLGLGPDIIDEKGAPLPALLARYIFTGSNSDGTARGQTCNNWTTNQNNQSGAVGDGNYTVNDNPNLGASWSFAAKTPVNVTCNVPANSKSQGRVYCFAKD